MKKITDLLLKLNEIDFKTHGAYKRYKTKHKMRPTTKVTIGGKTTTAGDADKVVAKADAIKRGAPETDPKALDKLAKVGMKSKAKSVDDYVVKDGDNFYVDSTDIDTGEAIAKPGEEVTFTQDGVEYTGTVSDEAEGRDDFLTGFRNWRGSTVQIAARNRFNKILKKSGLNPKDDISLDEMHALVENDPVIGAEGLMRI